MGIAYVNTNSPDGQVIGGGAAVLLDEVVAIGDLRPANAKMSTVFTVYMKNGRNIDIEFAADVTFLLAEQEHNKLVNAYETLHGGFKTNFPDLQERQESVIDPGGLRSEVGIELGNLMAYLTHAYIPEDVTAATAVKQFIEMTYAEDDPLMKAYFETFSKESDNHRLLHGE